MRYDYIIVGQGLAGSVLAFTLIKEGKSVLVIDNNPEVSSSKVAAGIFNPITGRKMVKTWLADELFPRLLTFYKELEDYIGEDILHEKKIYRSFSSIEEQNFMTAKSGSEEMGKYILTVSEGTYGGFETMGGNVHLKILIKGFRNKLIETDKLLEETFDFQSFSIVENGVSYKSFEADKIIFCDGFNLINNPYWNWLPMIPTQGEVLTVRIPHFNESRIKVKGGFILPLGNDLYKVGSTYEWQMTESITTEKGKSKLIEILHNFSDLEFEIVEHEAGVRPSTKDRRPFIGLHPQHQQIGVFNGLGTKGVSIAPYFSQILYSYLEHNKPLPKEVSIERFDFIPSN